MFPFRYSSIFRSRWIALIWAAGIIWTAVDFAGGSKATNNSDEPAPSSQDEKAALEVLNSFGK